MQNRLTTFGPLIAFTLAGAGSKLFVAWLLFSIHRSFEFEMIVDWIPGVSDRFAWFYVADAIIWALTGFALLNSRLSRAGAGWGAGMMIAFATTAILPVVASGDAGFRQLTMFPFNVLTLARAAVLFGMVKAFGARAARADASPSPAGPLRLPPLTRGQGEVTRLLCGHAILGGELFRAQFLRNFEENWKALAPEFGVDMGLVAAVAAAERDRYLRCAAVLAGIGLIFWLAVAAAVSSVTVLAVVAAMVVVTRYSLHTRRLARHFRRNAYIPEKARSTFIGKFKRHVRLPAAGDELVVYSGFNPFVGAGTELGGWSVAVLTDKPKIEGSPNSIKSFTIPDLYVSLREAAGTLAIAELDCRRLFFVAGTDIREDTDILGRDLAAYPRQAVRDERAEAIVLGADPLARHYLLLQVTDWGGDLVFSYFIRLEKRGRTLLLETKKFLLPPLAASFRSVDLMQPDRWTSAVNIAFGAIVTGPLLMAFAPLFLFGKGVERVAEALLSEHAAARKRQEAIELDPAYDYGVGSSVRERCAQNYFHHYFQKSDADLFNKLIEKRVLEELIAFLDDHGIDTSDLRERSTTILNSGILVQGGDVRADSLAVGSNAKATTNQTRQPQGATP